MVKNRPAMRETRVQFPGWEDPLEEGMATDSSTLAWRIPGTEEPGGLQSMGLQRAGHDWAARQRTWPWCLFHQHQNSLRVKVFSTSASKLYGQPRSPNQGFLLKDITESETKMVLPQKEVMGRNRDLCGRAEHEAQRGKSKGDRKEG